MAIYHCHVRRVCHTDAERGSNHSPSAVATAAYITGMRLYDASADVVRDYTANADGDRTHRVAYVAVELPEGAPEELRDVATLANAMERGGGRKDAQVGRTLEYALPRECSREEHIEIGESIAKGFAREGMCVIWAIHDDGDGNPHIHMLVSVRPLKPKPTWDPARPENVWGAKSRCAYLVRDGTGEERRMTAAELKAANAEGAGWAKVFNWKGSGEKVRLTMAEAEGRGLTRCGNRPVSSHVDATDWETKDALVRWRKLIADEINAGLDRHSAAHPDEEAVKHVSHLSNEDRGLATVPTVHVGTRSRMGKRDEYRERRLRLNARIKEHNAAIVNIIRRSVRVIPELVASWAAQDASRGRAVGLMHRNVALAKRRRARVRAAELAAELERELELEQESADEETAVSTPTPEETPQQQSKFSFKKGGRIPAQTAEKPVSKPEVVPEPPKPKRKPKVEFFLDDLVEGKAEKPQGQPKPMTAKAAQRKMVDAIQDDSLDLRGKIDAVRAVQDEFIAGASATTAPAAVPEPTPVPDVVFEEPRDIGQGRVAVPTPAPEPPSPSPKEQERKRVVDGVLEDLAKTADSWAGMSPYQQIQAWRVTSRLADLRAALGRAGATVESETVSNAIGDLQAAKRDFRASEMVDFYDWLIAELGGEPVESPAIADDYQSTRRASQNDPRSRAEEARRAAKRQSQSIQREQRSDENHGFHH